MGLYVFQHALTEFTRFRRLIVWLLAVVFLGLVAQIFSGVGPYDDPRQAYSQLSSILGFRLLPLASAIFTSAVISAEVEQKTIVYLITRPIPRQKLILFRALASVVVVGAISCLAMVALSLGVFGSEFLENDILMRDLKAMLIGALAYGGVFLFITLLFNRAMIISLLFAFGWETSVPNLPGDTYYLSIFSYLSAIAEHPAPDQTDQLLDLAAGQAGLSLITTDVAYPVLFLLIAAMYSVSAWWFAHFEYVPREDAE
jgi:ABC-2 type transport system permease protein